ncbi:hypothetical protein DFP72DRAFT_481603 [Ephemerocybe angulata]|uniref:Uncharacterized protein n=1 Tax=Ephemerocybe angulata TaxID=980116 RepID=A0A8H6MCR1_9AGAR|nr:hypothetical protein DFP72DRAFT_481603 [Tulosesus angulatus]
MTSFRNPFPQELLDNITDCVSLICRQSLRNLSLTSRQHFLHRSQSHMFAHVGGEFLAIKIFNGNPALLRHVQSYDLWLWRANSVQYDEWQKTHLQIAEGLVNLRRLLLTVANVQGWGESTELSRNVVRKLLSHTSLVELAVYVSKFPVHLIASIPGLRKLEASRELSTEGLRDIAGYPWTLRTLLCNGYTINKLPLSRSTFKNLTTLSFEIGSAQQQTTVRQFIEGISGFAPLKVLGLHYSSIRAFECFAQADCALPPLPLLRRLRLSFMTEGPEAIMSAQPRLHLFIPSFPIPLLHKHPLASLEVLEIVYLAVLNGLWREGMLLTIRASETLYQADEAWRMLDDILSDTALLPNLRALRVKASYVPTKWSKERNPEEKRSLKELTERRGGEILVALPQTFERIHDLDAGVHAQAGERFDSFAAHFGQVEH